MGKWENCAVVLVSECKVKHLISIIQIIDIYLPSISMIEQRDWASKLSYLPYFSIVTDE